MVTQKRENGSLSTIIAFCYENRKARATGTGLYVFPLDVAFRDQKLASHFR